MSTKAVIRGVRLSAQKARLVADQIRGLPVAQALEHPGFQPEKGRLASSRRHWIRRLPMPSITTVQTSTN